MIYKVIFKPSAERDLKHLPKIIQKQIAAKIGMLIHNPHLPGIKKLQGKEGFLRLRAGDYRIIYLPNNQIKTITILRIQHRREVYRRL